MNYYDFKLWVNRKSVDELEKISSLLMMLPPEIKLNFVTTEDSITLGAIRTLIRDTIVDKKNRGER